MSVEIVPDMDNHIDVTLSLDKNPGMWAFMTELVFDLEELTLVSIDGHDDLYDFVVSIPPLRVSRYPERRVFPIMSAEVAHSTGLLATARFEVTDEINHLHDIPISIGYFFVSVYDPDTEDMTKSYRIPPFEDDFGALSSSLVDRVTLGRINSDPITSASASFIARYVAGRRNFQFNINAADINRDGVISLQDATLLLRQLMNEDIGIINGFNYSHIGVNMHYRILTNSAGGTETRRQAEEIMDRPGAGDSLGIMRIKGVEDIFRETFNVNLIRQSSEMTPELNMKSGCLASGTHAICILPRPNPNPPPANLPGCGTALNGSDCQRQHHRAAGHLVRVDSVRNINTFRFVNYTICDYGTNLTPNHRDVYGLALGGGIVLYPFQRDMVVSLALNEFLHRNTTAHEISHLLGASDGGCGPNMRSCVMSTNNANRSAHLWCPNHATQILSGIR
jgi:hypothetical protein